jgi:plastocyanin
MPAAAIVLCVLAVVLAGCGSGGGYAPANLRIVQPPASTAPGFTPTATTHPAVRVTVKNIAFNPSTIHLKVGQTVEWINRDNVVHNVTSTNDLTITSPTLGIGQRFAFKATTPGVIRYFCTIHASSMHGAIVVTK